MRRTFPIWQVHDASIDDLDLELWDADATQLLGTCNLSVLPLLLKEVQSALRSFP